MIRGELGNVFCGFEWLPYVPEELQNLTPADWLQKSRNHMWAPYYKALGERSPARFRRSDIVNWFVRHWQISRPDCVQALLDSNLGFEMPPPEPKGMKAKIKAGIATSRALKKKRAKLTKKC